MGNGTKTNHVSWWVTCVEGKNGWRKQLKGKTENSGEQLAPKNITFRNPAWLPYLRLGDKSSTFTLSRQWALHSFKILSHRFKRSPPTTPPHRFGGCFVPLDTLAVLRGACVWAVAAAVFADVSWLSYVHPAVLAESLAAVWQLRQAATWEQAGRVVRMSSESEPELS